MVDLSEIDENENASNSDSSEEVAESIEEFLQPKAIKFLEERRRKSIEEKKREEEKAAKEAKVEAYRSKYKELVLQTRERLAQEDVYCGNVFNSDIVPYLERIRRFAEEKNTYPTAPSEKPPDILPQLFSDLRRNDYHPSKNFKVPYFWTQEDDLEEQFKKQAEELSFLHSYRQCGLEWGYKTSERRNTGEDGWGNSHYWTDYFIVTFGISIQISHTGEVTINDLLFNRNELSGNRFRQALSDAFYAPKQIRRTYISTDEYAEGTEMRLIEMARNIMTAWKKLWGTPENDTKPEDSFLRKLWYGFPHEETNQDEKDTW